MDTISQNKNTVTSFIQAQFTKGDLGAVDEYLAEDFVNHDPPMGVPADRDGMLLSAYGLTNAQSRVVALVIRGHSTRRIVEELHISANTVQEHLTAAFDKFGVRSRRELVAAMLTGRPA